MSEDTDDWSDAQKTIEHTNALVKGNKLYHDHQGHKYEVQFDTSSVTTVNVIDKTAQSAKAAELGRPGKGDWVVRLDKPHVGTDYDHVNINSKISGVPDPHLKLPAGGLATGKTVAGICTSVNKLNKIAMPVAIAVDVLQTGVSVYNDGKHGTTRNTVETVASVAGGWGGGYGGALGGAAIGTAIFPGIGTILGGICGAIGGAIGGSVGAAAVADGIGDACEYNIVTKKCKACGKTFKIRQYQGEKDTPLCPKCA